MNTTKNGEGSTVYEPNGDPEAPVADKKFAWNEFKTDGTAGRFAYSHPNSDFEQPGNFYRDVLDAGAKERIVKNIVGHMEPVTEDVKLRQMEIFKKVDADFASRIAKAQGLTIH